MISRPANVGVEPRRGQRQIRAVGSNASSALLFVVCFVVVFFVVVFIVVVVLSSLFLSAERAA